MSLLKSQPEMQTLWLSGSCTHTHTQQVLIFGGNITFSSNGGGDVLQGFVFSFRLVATMKISLFRCCGVDTVHWNTHQH
jgi:hypothetical protein